MPAVSKHTKNYFRIVIGGDRSSKPEQEFAQATSRDLELISRMTTGNPTSLARLLFTRLREKCAEGIAPLAGVEQVTTEVADLFTKAAIQRIKNGEIQIE